jgi:hypothetical protein
MWIGLACVVAVIGAVGMAMMRRTVHANQLGSVSAHWIAEHRTDPQS